MPTDTARPPTPAPPGAMGPPPGAPPGAQCMQLRLELRRAHPDQPWSAELAVPGASGRLTFPSLEALAHWLSRLNRRPEGLR